MSLRQKVLSTRGADPLEHHRDKCRTSALSPATDRRPFLSFFSRLRITGKDRRANTRATAMTSRLIRAIRRRSKEETLLKFGLTVLLEGLKSTPQHQTKGYVWSGRQGAFINVNFRRIVAPLLGGMAVLESSLTTRVERKRGPIERLTLFS